MALAWDREIVSLNFAIEGVSSIEHRSFFFEREILKVLVNDQNTNYSE
jgi:hypothetical protein